MTQRVTIECDRCGRTADDRRDWVYVDWRGDHHSQFDLCHDCQVLVVRELELLGRRPVSHD